MKEYIHFEWICRVYVDLMDCLKILPEHSRDNDKPKYVGKFLYSTPFSHGIHLGNTSFIFLATPTLDTCTGILITNQNIQKARQTFVTM